MLRSLLVLALLAAMPLAGAVGATALYTQFDNAPSEQIFDALQAEVNQVLDPTGVHLTWMRLPAEGDTIWTDVAVVSFRGNCQLQPRRVNQPPADRLGWTHIQNGEVIPFADIDCTAIAVYLQTQLAALPAKSRQAALGRAIGRVLSHELLHIFSRAKSHSSEGVDHPTLKPAELTEEQPHLADDLRILKTTSGHPPQPSTGSAPAGEKEYRDNGCGACHGMRGEGTRRAPALRATGKSLTNIILAAKLTKHQKTMLKEAKKLKIPPPAFPEAEMADLISYLNQPDW